MGMLSANVCVRHLHNLSTRCPLGFHLVLTTLSLVVSSGLLNRAAQLLAGLREGQTFCSMVQFLPLRVKHPSPMQHMPPTLYPSNPDACPMEAAKAGVHANNPTTTSRASKC